MESKIRLKPPFLGVGFQKFWDLRWRWGIGRVLILFSLKTTDLEEEDAIALHDFLAQRSIAVRHYEYLP